MTDAAPTGAETLTIVLTLQGLILAAMSIGSALSAETEFGRDLPISPELVAYALSCAVLLLGISALVEWWTAYGICSANVWDVLRTVPIPIASIAIVGASFWTAESIRREGRQ